MVIVVVSRRRRSSFVFVVCQSSSPFVVSRQRRRRRWPSAVGRSVGCSVGRSVVVGGGRWSTVVIVHCAASSSPPSSPPSSNGVVVECRRSSNVVGRRTSSASNVVGRPSAVVCRRSVDLWRRSIARLPYAELAGVDLPIAPSTSVFRRVGLVSIASNALTSRPPHDQRRSKQNQFFTCIQGSSK